MQPIEPVLGVDLGYREPVYDIKVSAQKQSPFNQISHNQFIMELFQNGFFNPAAAEQAAAAVSLMEFNGKQKMLQLLGESMRTAAAVPLPEEVTEENDDTNYIPQ